MHRPYTEYSGSRVIREFVSLDNAAPVPYKALAVFHSTLQGELYIAKMLDNKLKVEDVLKAKVFKEDFEKQNRDHSQTLRLSAMRLGPSSMIALVNIMRR
jgi:hypothetical protein